MVSDGPDNVHAVLTGLGTGSADGTAEVNHLASGDVKPVVPAVSAAGPPGRFTVRGTGEEMRDLWLRQCEAGQVVYSVGPFDAA